VIKKLLFIVAIASSVGVFSSCKKIIEAKERSIILNAITTGHWYVELYKDTTTDVTPEFSGYEFQFYDNYTVDGILNGTVRSNGTWAADETNYTISANFPASAGDTLLRLNHTWKISDSYLDYVVCSTPAPGGGDSLHLRKR